MKFLSLLFYVPLGISRILEIFIKNSSYTNKQCWLHKLSANTFLYVRKDSNIRIGQFLHPVPTFIAFCQMVTIHASFLPGNDINPWGCFCYREIMAQHRESSLSRSRRSLVFAQASHLVNATGLGQLWILMIHGWLYQGALAWSSWS